MDDTLAAKDARITTSLEIDLDSENPDLVDAIAELKPILHKILKTMQEASERKLEGSDKDELCDGGFSKVAKPCPTGFSKVVKPCDGGFSKVHYTETITSK